MLSQSKRKKYPFKWHSLRYQARMLKHRPKLLWDKLWLRQDKFHGSLNMNTNALLDMNTEDRKHYVMDLVRRRNQAHRRDAG